MTNRPQPQRADIAEIVKQHQANPHTAAFLDRRVADLYANILKGLTR